MQRKKSYVTCTDQFCGAGGSSLGAVAAGAEVSTALNHWKLAISTHQANFPDTRHDCTDISACDPRRYPRTDILITSPECTNHSLAKGRKRPHYKQDLFGNVLIDPSEERSRATMWDVPRFAEYHDYACIIVENVVDAREWVLYDAWLHAMQALGYAWRAVYFNSMFAPPTPQSRDRMYVVFWKAGNRAPDLDLQPRAWCTRCDVDVDAVQTWKRADRTWGRYGARGQYLYTCPDCRHEAYPYYCPALTAIDWSLPTPRIGDRARPLKERTLARIRLGLERFKDQYLVLETQYSHARNNRAHPVAHPWPTQTGQQSLALVGMPFLAMLRTNSTPRGMDDPLQTVVTDNQHFLVEPAIVELRNHGDARPVSAPLATVTAGGNHHGLLMPFLTRHYSSRGGDASLSRDVTEPLGTVTAQDHHSLTMPFLASYYGSETLRAVDDAMGTLTGTDRHALVQPAPFIVSQYGGEKRNPVHSVGEPMMTVPGMHIHSLAQPGGTVDVEDCGFRMLEPHEIGAAMAFPATYTVLGNKRERVKQYGNAVCPPVMQLLIERCVATLG
jgi:DNA (cytosine-5)-methyltransferase 1